MVCVPYPTVGRLGSLVVKQVYVKFWEVGNERSSGEDV